MNNKKNILTFKKCDLNDLISLKQISCKTFRDTFAHLNNESNMNAYLENAYNLDKLSNELHNNSSSFYFLYYDDVLAGYMKINEYQTQTDIHDSNSIELERIYLLNDFQGKGLGQSLINKAVEISTQKKKTYIWLGVWEKNYKAIRFYKNAGFYKIGEHPFIMGDDKQTDYIFRKDLKTTDHTQ